MYAHLELLNKFNRGSTNKIEYKLENNTWVIRDNIDFIIQLHGSFIARITPDKIILNSCGYRTMTTKDRLNKILSDNKTGFTIYQVNYNWRVYGFYYFPKTYTPFYNGIEFNKHTSDWSVIINTE